LRRLGRDPERALADASKAVELAPNDDIGQLVLGLVLFYRLGRFDEAAAEFATAMRRNPRLYISPRLYIGDRGLHATALSAAGHYAQAIAEIDAAIAADPQNPSGQIFSWRRRGMGRALRRCCPIVRTGARTRSGLGGVCLPAGRGL
jgi:tetratricopeptide (TPR) repeat protein